MIQKVIGALKKLTKNGTCAHQKPEKFEFFTALAFSFVYFQEFRFSSNQVILDSFISDCRESEDQLVNKCHASTVPVQIMTAFVNDYFTVSVKL